jgi:hypothetical protein
VTVLEDQILRAAKRVAQLSARQMVRDMRQASRTKVRERRDALRRRSSLGDAVVIAGCAHWPAAELVGLLIDGRERFEHSPTQRLALRKRGELLLPHVVHPIGTADAEDMQTSD